MDKFIQKKAFKKKEFIFQKDGIVYKNSDISSSFEKLIPYEEIEINKYTKETESSSGFILFVYGIFIFTTLIYTISNLLNIDKISSEYVIGNLILIIFTIFLGILNNKLKEEIITIQTQLSGELEVFGGIPNNQEVGEFLDSLKKAVKEHLKSKYSKVDYDLPHEPQLLNLSWLREIDVITDLEYEKLKETLKNSNQANIGF